MPEARLPRVLALALVAVLASGCGLFGGDDEDTTDISVFSVKPGQCFVAPTVAKAQVSDLSRVACGTTHEQEAYAVAPYVAPDGTSSDEFPGDDAMTKFAEGACAAEFGDYVGVNYLDSALFFTYLLPSPRSWEDDDRSVVCFVTAAGAPLKGSVKGSKR